MQSFAFPPFDTKDASEASRPSRERYFSYFRVPVTAENHEYVDQIKRGPNQLLAADGVPLMPLQSGDNSVTKDNIYKFLTLTPTQYFFLSQWAKGQFEVGKPADKKWNEAVALDRAVIGNCVGGPLSPGIETTWMVRNPNMYAGPFQLKPAHWEKGDTANADLIRSYRQNGLSTSNDPQRGGGLEPGDLTKQMAIPWQADFDQCTAETPNMVVPTINQGAGGIQIPPCYYVYWWPPQAPQHVMAGALDPGAQVLDGYVSSPPQWLPDANNNGNYTVQSSNYSVVAAGQPVAYLRGINNIAQMRAAWADLGFIVNRGTAEYPNFVESERNTIFMAQGVVTGSK